jgi:hypothetical protein
VIPEFATLDEAVRASFPQDSCRIVAVHEHGDAAVALFDTRPSAQPYLYEVHYQRQNGRWSEGHFTPGSTVASRTKLSALLPPSSPALP